MILIGRRKTVGYTRGRRGAVIGYIYACIYSDSIKTYYKISEYDTEQDIGYRVSRKITEKTFLNAVRNNKRYEYIHVSDPRVPPWLRKQIRENAG